MVRLEGAGSCPPPARLHLRQVSSRLLSPSSQQPPLRIRSFRRVTFHINNHYSRDIQVFARAKIYFSNEEGKFGDDRAVDFLYMPDTVIEDARNVSVNLHGEHGRFVMVQLFFAAKWILISEVTFESGTEISFLLASLCSFSAFFVSRQNLNR